MDTPDLDRIRALLESRPARILDGDEVHSRAAVAAILRPARETASPSGAVVRPAPAEPELLLIRRSERPGDPWSGHMAFPGGRAQPSDPDLVHTVIRETREEIGLDLAQEGELLGRLDDIPARSLGRTTGLAVAPFVFAIRAEPALILNHEVAEALWTPLGPLLRGEVHTTLDYEHEGRKLILPGYLVGPDRVVWGLTYYMLQSLFAVIAGASAG